MKTEQDIAEQIAVCAVPYSPESGWQRIDLEIACYEMARHIQRWIPVDEQYPAEYEWIIAKSNLGDHYIANYSRNKYHVNMPFEVKITHWRPIEYK